MLGVISTLWVQQLINGWPYRLVMFLWRKVRRCVGFAASSVIALPMARLAWMVCAEEDRRWVFPRTTMMDVAVEADMDVPVPPPPMPPAPPANRNVAPAVLIRNPATVYTSKHGDCYHLSRACVVSRSTRPENVESRRACDVCVPRAG